MNTLRKLVEGWEMSAGEFSAMATSARYESSRLRYGQVCDEISNCADELSAELPKWERLLEAAAAVAATFADLPDVSLEKAANSYRQVRLPILGRLTPQEAWALRVAVREAQE